MHILVHPVLTTFDAGPDLGTFVLTFTLGAFGVSLLSTGANILLAQVVVVTSCNLPGGAFSCSY